MKKSILFFTAVLMFTLTSVADEPLKAGDPAADFNLKNVEGKMISLSQFNDAKGFIVVFYCNTCPVVHNYEQRVIDLHKEFSSKGFPVIAINPNDKDASPGDSYQEMQKLAGKKNYEFQYLYDESQEVARKYGATNTPHVYVLSKKSGQLKVEYVGAIDNNADDASAADKHYVADAVNKLLKGESVAVTGTKAIGCTIKWRKI
ncbi:MAG TPA: thioredoxin family protein [Bacteroidales bacterium]|nr:thioredoxin family protein [Bacteroidales bacterium]